MPFSNYSQYLVVSRNSANGIKNIHKMTLFELLTVPCGKSYFCKGH